MEWTERPANKSSGVRAPDCSRVFHGHPGERALCSTSDAGRAGRHMRTVESRSSRRRRQSCSQGGSEPPPELRQGILRREHRSKSPRTWSWQRILRLNPTSFSNDNRIAVVCLAVQLFAVTLQAP